MYLGLETAWIPAVIAALLVISQISIWAAVLILFRASQRLRQADTDLREALTNLDCLLTHTAGAVGAASIVDMELRKALTSLDLTFTQLTASLTDGVSIIANGDKDILDIVIAGDITPILDDCSAGAGGRH